MNKIILSGGITRDAELSFIGSTGMPKMSFSLAVERGYQKKGEEKRVDFINCEMLGAHVEKLSQYITKGKQIVVEEEERRKRAEFNSNILMPYFLTELVKWENKVGVKSEFWSEEEHNKFKNYFMSKYGKMIK